MDDRVVLHGLLIRKNDLYTFHKMDDDNWLLALFGYKKHAASDSIPHKSFHQPHDYPQ